MRAHLLGIAGVVLVLTGGVGIGLTGRAYATARNRSVASVRDTAGQVAQAVERDLGQALDLTVASAPSIAGSLAQAAAITAHPELCSLSFTGVGVFPAGALHILTGDGRVLCSSAPGAVGMSYASAGWFARLVRGEPVAEADGRDAVSGQPGAIAASAVPGADGKVAGYLVTVLPAGPLAPALAQLYGGSAQSEFVVVDNTGRALSSSVEPASPGRVLARIGDGDTVADSRGTRRIWGVRPASRLGWRVLAGTGEARALAPARSERVRLAVVLAIALVAYAVLTLLVNRRLLQPVRDLSTTVGRAETERGARASVDGPTELAALAERLNHMLDTREHDEQLVAQLARELEATAVGLVEAREQERQSLALALHDTTLQGLLAALWALDLLADSGADPAVVTRLRRDLERTAAQTRDLTSELRPPALEEGGLGTAIAKLGERARADSDLSVEIEDRLDGARFAVALETLVYRTVQEAIQNVRKHARATRVQIRLETSEDLLRAIIVDDGVGIDDAVLARREAEGHYGVISMRDTIHLAKGRFSIARAETGGTMVHVEVPFATTRSR